MKKILIQLDTDAHASSFDRVVAIDSGVDQLFSYANVTPENVVGLVHGAIFTRGPKDLKNTALFLGGSDTAACEAVQKKVEETFFGPMRVSCMVDPNGSATTAAAAVLAAENHLDLAQTKAVVLGGTGPVGFRACQLLAMQGAEVTLVSRSLDKAQAAADRIALKNYKGQVTAAAASDSAAIGELSQHATLLIASGAAGVQFLNAEQISTLTNLKVAIDLNAVPPVGLEGVEVMAQGQEVANTIFYGAIGVGGTKMKIHKTAIRTLFEANNQILETESLFHLGQKLS